MRGKYYNLRKELDLAISAATIPIELNLSPTPLTLKQDENLTCVEQSELAFVTSVLASDGQSVTTPKTMREAEHSEDREFWIAGTVDEFHNTFSDPVPLPIGVLESNTNKMASKYKGC